MIADILSVTLKALAYLTLLQAAGGALYQATGGSRLEQSTRAVRALIMSSAFVADCLETIEELGMRASCSFKAEGGETLRLVPSLNAADYWADGVVALARETSAWLR